ncbi:4596_t:CDS:2 [Rhizophagus irregularis]|nr:4596_t:CDS:2 [Rhizophagus irregularis]
MYTPYIKQQFPNYSSNEIMKEAAHQWNNTPQDLKNSFLIYAVDEEVKEVEKDCHQPDDDELFRKFINMP